MIVPNVTIYKCIYFLSVFKYFVLLLLIISIKNEIGV